MLELNGEGAPEQVDYSTEAFIYQELTGVPSVIWGPGSIAQAHRPNEYVELAELYRATSFLEKLLVACEAGTSAS